MDNPIIVTSNQNLISISDKSHKNYGKNIIILKQLNFYFRIIFSKTKLLNCFIKLFLLLLLQAKTFQKCFMRRIASPEASKYLRWMQRATIT
jgi:hypothetical protein